ncbi:hypothetical protein MHYP_G00196830 [Metynnis hypsauchen]
MFVLRATTALKALDIHVSIPAPLAPGATWLEHRTCLPAGPALQACSATPLVSLSPQEYVLQDFIVLVVLELPYLKMELQETGAQQGIFAHKAALHLSPVLMAPTPIVQVLQSAVTVLLDGSVWKARKPSCVQRGITAWGAQWRTSSPAPQAHTVPKQDRAK